MEYPVQFMMAALDHSNEMFCFVFLSPREGEIQKYKQTHQVSLQRQENESFGFVLLKCVHEA